MADVTPRTNKRETPAAFLIKSSEGRRESIAPEDLPAYLEQRKAILDKLKAYGA